MDGLGIYESDGVEVKRPGLMIDTDMGSESWPLSSTTEDIDTGWDTDWPIGKLCPGRMVSNPKRAVRAMEAGLPGMDCGALIKP